MHGEGHVRKGMGLLSARLVLGCCAVLFLPHSKKKDPQQRALLSFIEPSYFVCASL